MSDIGSLSLLVPGSFTDDDPYQGLEDTLRLFEYGERLGFDGAWIRQQHLVPNVSSAAVFLAANLRGGFLGGEDTVVPHPAGPQRPRLRPHAPGLAERLWYGAGSLRSVIWAAEHGLHLVVGNICAGEGLDTDDFGTAQLTQIRGYRQKFTGPGKPRVVAGRVIVPLDGADAATRRQYRDYQASRHQRTRSPQGPRRVLIAPDLVGTSAEIVEWLRADPVLGEVTELQLELPYAFAHQQYEQILADVAASVAPRLGWSPAE